MKQVVIVGDQLEVGPRWVAAPAFPQDSILIGRTPFTLYGISWDHFFHMCQQIKQQFGDVGYVFVDATWDPIRTDNQELIARREEMQKIFSTSKVVILTLHSQHFYDNLPGVIYVPFFAMINLPTPEFRPRAGRFGCLNRRPTLHRIRLMYSALTQNLLDSHRDVYSIRFVNLYTDTPYNFDSSGYEWMAKELQQWPSEIATHPDGFPCDYSINHPAWHTGIVIINETEVGDHTIICEKTAKGIVSKSCFSVYMADVGYRVLEDLGFEPRFFPEHAEYDHIDPVLDLFRTIATESDAMDCRQQHIAQINHNYNWFGVETSEFWRRPWWAQYQPKLSQALANL